MGVEGVWTSSRVKGRALAGGGAAPHERGEAERARRAKPNKEERRIPKHHPPKARRAKPNKEERRIPKHHPPKARRAKPNKEERRIPTRRIPTRLASKMISIKRTKLTFGFVYIKFTN